MKKFFTVFAVLVFIAPLSNSLEMKMGKMKLILHEDDGSLSLYGTEAPSLEEYTSLLLEQDPRTSGMNLIIDGEIIDPCVNKDFQQKVFRTTYGAKFMWVSKNISVEESFYAIKSVNSEISDGIIIEIKVNNLTEKPMSIGVKYIFDTWLGEQNNYHFYTADGSTIESEEKFIKNMPIYWVSAKNKDEKNGLLVMLKGEGVTPPDEVVFANWKRLKDSAETINYVRERNFDMQPYSKSDSAVCHYYSPVIVKAGTMRYISIIIGMPSGEGFTEYPFAHKNAQQDNTKNSDLLANEEKVTLQEIIKNEIMLSEDFISYIEKILQNPRIISKDEMNSLKIMVNKLEQIKNDIDNK